MSDLVIGLGHPDRGDDGIGRLVARAVAALGLPAVQVVEHDDPIRLLDRWSSPDQVVLVDAVRSGEPVGTVQVHDLLSLSLPPVRSAASSHALDLAGTVELGRALGQLPRRLFLVGVEADTVAVGADLTPAVRAAVDEAVQAVVGALRRTRGELPPTG